VLGCGGPGAQPDGSRSSRPWCTGRPPAPEPNLAHPARKLRSATSRANVSRTPWPHAPRCSAPGRNSRSSAPRGALLIIHRGNAAPKAVGRAAVTPAMSIPQPPAKCSTCLSRLRSSSPSIAPTTAGAPAAGAHRAYGINAPVVIDAGIAALVNLSALRSIAARGSPGPDLFSIRMAAASIGRMSSPRASGFRHRSTRPRRRRTAFWRT
jgi:hypothetical protein